MKRVMGRQGGGVCSPREGARLGVPRAGRVK